MEFINEREEVIDISTTENTEQQQAEEYITEDCVVLELGARYGTVSCKIAANLSDQTNLVAVEPDSRVWDILEKNRETAGCQFHIVKGVISKKPLGLTNLDNCDGYGTCSVTVESSQIPNYTLNEIKEKYGLRFNTLVADCEGFLGQFLEENPEIYDEINLILFETDYPDRCNYELIRQTLSQKGFTELVTGFHQVWKKL